MVLNLQIHGYGELEQGQRDPVGILALPDPQRTVNEVRDSWALDFYNTGTMRTLL